DRHVLPIEGHDPRAACEFAQQARIGELADQDRRDLATGGVGGAIEETEIESERIAREREHAAELACTDDADGHVGAAGPWPRGSPFSSTLAVWRARKSLSAASIFGSDTARIAAAINAALVAPAAPIASV